MDTMTTTGIDKAEDKVEQQNGLVHLQKENDQVRPKRPSAPRPAGTLLPGPVANVVSFATRSTCFALRISTAVCSHSLGAAKVTALSTLELGRDILNGILTKAGRDVFVESPSDMARADAESILEMSLETMHQTMSRLVFWTAAGFHAVGTTVSTASQVSQLFLSVLDQFFGSTDSSRAIASIITLVRREFQNPATGVEGERVGVMDLVLGLCGLAYLQNKCRRMMQEESRRLGYEEVVWDVVVLNDGERIDTPHDGICNVHRVQSIESNDMTNAVTDQQTLRRSSTSDEDSILEVQLRKQIAKSLPDDAKISISTSSTVVKTITVDITGASGISIPSFPGLGLVQSEISDPPQPGHGSSYRVVYRVTRNKVRSIPGDSQDEMKRRSSVEELDNDDNGRSVSPVSPICPKLDIPAPVPPPKTIRTTVTIPSKGRGNISKESLSRKPRSPSEEPICSRNPSIKASSIKSVTSRKERTANQKVTRAPLDKPRQRTRELADRTLPNSAASIDRKPNKKPDANLIKRGEKKTSVRGVLGKSSGPTLASLSRESSSDNLPSIKSKPVVKTIRGGRIYQNKASSPPPKLPIPERTSSIIPNHDVPQPPPHGNLNYFSSRDLGSPGKSGLYKGTSRSPMFSVQDRRRSSLVSLTDTISIRSYGSQTPSPPPQSELIAGTSSLNQNSTPGVRLNTPSPQQARAPPRDYTPSIYTLRTRDSEASLVVSSFYPKSAYGDSMALDSLRKSGEVRGMFPDFHFLRNITRYSRYASAVYGYNFLKLMGISKDRPTHTIADEVHYDVRSFAHHARLSPDSVLLASFVDPQGGSDSTGATDTGIPLVHTVTLDEESKAVVLTCRGTLGFEDVLADMMCDYDDLLWRGSTYKVHKGIHASARRLLYGGDGRVLATIKAALEEFPDYGLVLCGHSLGGAVTALLGVMLAEPTASGVGFRTSATENPKLLNEAGSSEAPAHIYLPPGRPIHVYAYGPPATMSPSLQKATSGLITSTVHGNDMVPYLSLGVLHDFQALALAFKTDNNEAKAEVKRRVWAGLRSGLADKWYDNPTNRSSEDDEHWGYIALKTLRVSMMSSKLLPPGEVFKIDTTPVMRRDAFTQEAIDDIGRPARRIVLKYIRDVEAHFREVRFGASMLTDHSPGRYEDALGRLALGVVNI
ncbi:hypothetical protein F5Y14DRAFT_74623 [Nemania sp. NC0429]|nr:hypothetical protein F5Y14DRAFT_74623 [Nemania sp. NC0429]